MDKYRFSNNISVMTRSGRQEKMIDAITSGRDVLGIMPTGAGKSCVIRSRL